MRSRGDNLGPAAELANGLALKVVILRVRLAVPVSKPVSVTPLHADLSLPQSRPGT